MSAEGIEAQQDFENYFFGLNGEEQVGTPCQRIRERYKDQDGRWIPEATIDTALLFVPTQATQPYGVSEIGLTNIKNGNPIQIYLPYSQGRPLETDRIVMSNTETLNVDDTVTYALSNVLPVPYGNVILAWQAEMVRVGNMQ